MILGDTGIGMSVRGEQFWLDQSKANQIRPHARPRYTLPAMRFFTKRSILLSLSAE